MIVFQRISVEKITIVVPMDVIVVVNIMKMEVQLQEHRQVVNIVMFVILIWHQSMQNIKLKRFILKIYL